ncbi:hypothetical protein Tco_0587088, partial [Tanacetum coccineum]
AYAGDTLDIQIKFSEFVGRHIGEKAVIILEAETGDLPGVHRGFLVLHNWSTSRYVVEKDDKDNVVFVSRNNYSVDKRRRSFWVGSFR